MSNTVNDTKSTDPQAPNFCWFKFLNQPESDFSKEDLNNATILSKDWITCACGQLCKDLERHECNTPKDDALYILGIRFMDLIENARSIYVANTELFMHEIKEAKLILLEIEKRTDVLLRNITYLNSLAD